MYRYVDSLDDLLDLREWFGRQPYVALDTETSGLDVHAPNFHVRLIQFGNKDDAWVMDCENWLGFVKDILNTYKGRIVGHNIGGYDSAALRAVGIYLPWEKVDDTLIAMRLAQPHRNAALKDVTARLISPKAAASQDQLHKAMKKHGWGWDTVPHDLPEYRFYAAMDVILNSRLYEHEVCQRGLQSPVYEMEMDVRAICSDMEWGGMRVNIPFAQETAERLRREASDLAEQIHSAYGFSISSGPQLARWLLERGVKLSVLTGGGAPSVSKDALEAARYSATGEAADVMDAVLRSRKIVKLASTYFDSFVEKSTDGLLHPQIQTVQARTMRMSITNPAMQTLPRTSEDPDSRLVRQAIIPRKENHYLISSDFSQIELRIIASLSEDPNLMEAFRNADETGEDLFVTSMRLVYGDPTLEKSDPRRSLVKNTMYAACPTPDQLVLCDDLIWRPAGDLGVGQGLYAFDENLNDHQHPRARARKWRRSEIQYTDITERDCVRVVLESGKELTCADDHMWLVQHATHSNSVGWKMSKDLRPTFDALPKYCETWERDLSYDAGWLSGILDGEGHFMNYGSNFHWGITQKPGPVSDKIESILAKQYGIDVYRTFVDKTGVNRYTSRSTRIYNALEFLGKLQPVRLVPKADPSGRTMWRLPEDRGGKDRVVAVEPIGRQPTVTLQTSTHTYMCEGYGAHNSYGAGVAKMAATAKVSVEEMRAVTDAVFGRFSGIKRYMKVCEKEALSNDNWITTPFGRRIWVDPDHSYKALNAKVQGFAGDIFKQTMVNLANAGLVDYMVCPIHDEVLFSVPEEDLDEVSHTIAEVMPYNDLAVAVPADPSPGVKDWSQAK